MNNEKWFAAAKNAGFESFEIYQQLSEERKFTWFEGTLDTYVTSHVLGTAFRGIYDGKMVNASSEDTSDDQMDDILDSLKSQAEMITSTEKDMIRRPEEVSLRAEKKPESEDADTIKKLLAECEKKIRAFDERVAAISHLEYEEGIEKRTIANSYGMDLCDSTSVHVIVAGVTVRENGETRTNFEIEKIDRIEDFDMDDFVKRLCEEALGKLNAEIPSSSDYPVIIEKGAFTQLFAAFSSMFSGEQIYKGISPLSNKADTKIFSELITVIDDPANEDAAFAAAFDDEGCPVRCKKVVENGIFKTALHSTRSALAMNTESTGNGFRSGYSGIVNAAPHNLYIVPGEKSLDEMMQDMKEGILITDFAGLHAGLNHVNGDFSLQCAGYAVKYGKKAGGLTLMTAAGNIFDLLSNVIEVGSDLKWGIHRIVTPSIRFANIAISGK